MTYRERFLSLRLETRKLRQDCTTYFRAWESQKEKSERLARENGELKKENKDLKDYKLSSQTAIPLSIFCYILF